MKKPIAAAIYLSSQRNPCLIAICLRLRLSTCGKNILGILVILRITTIFERDIKASLKKKELWLSKHGLGLLLSVRGCQVMTLTKRLVCVCSTIYTSDDVDLRK